MNIATQAMSEIALRPLPEAGGPARQAERARDHVQEQGARRMALLVLGMHRSGTSALTRVFALLGAGLPATLLGANATNPTGHWESDAVRMFNDATLAEVGSDWFDWLAVNEGWSRSLAYHGHVERARAVLRAEFAEAPLFALKDPRICRLAGFWLDALHAEGVAAAIVMPLRNPLEVADSLARRDGVDGGIALLVWLRHVLDAEAATRGRARLVVSYEQVLNQWALVAERVERELGVVWPRAPLGVGEEVEAFLSQDLRHHRRADGAVVDNPLVSGWVRRVYGVLLGWAERGERACDYGELDAVRAALDEAGPGFARPLRRIAQQQRALEEMQAQWADLTAQRAGLEARVETLTGELAQRGRERQEAVDGLAELARAYQLAQARLDEMALDEGRGGEERAAMAREIEHLRAQAPLQEQRAQEAQAHLTMLEQEAGALRASLDEHQARLGELESALARREEELGQARIGLEQERRRCAGLAEAVEREREQGSALLEALESERQRAEGQAWEFEQAQEQAQKQAQEQAHALIEELAAERALLQEHAGALGGAMEQVAVMAEMLTALRGDLADQGEALAAARGAQAAWAIEARETKAAALDQQAEATREIAQLVRLLQEAEGEAALWQGHWQEGEQDRAATATRHAQAEQAWGEQGRRLEQRIAEMDQARGRVVEERLALLAEKVRLEQQLSERFGELATMSGLLSTESERAMRSARQAEWLREVYRVTARRPRWWGVMPRRWQQARMAQRLAEAELFDEDAYLARYPDVAAQGHDPLRHYILFGMAEGRVRG